MVPGNFSRFISVHRTRPTLIYTNYMVPGSFYRFIVLNWTHPTRKYANYMVLGSFSFHFSPLNTSDYKIC